jgi:hypothetical protein
MFLLLPMTPLFAFLLEAYIWHPAKYVPHEPGITHPVKHTVTNATGYAFVSERLIHAAVQ